VGIAVVFLFYGTYNLSNEERIYSVCRPDFSDHGVDRNNQCDRSGMGKIYAIVIGSFYTAGYFFQKLRITIEDFY